MSRDKLIAGGLFALGLAALGAMALPQFVQPAMAQDGPGPNLVIKVRVAADVA